DDPERTEPDHDDWVSEAPVPHALPPPRGAVLVDRQGLNVPHAAAIEVAGGRVMDRVLTPPERKRRAGEDPERGAEQGVRALGLQERAVRAIVEDDEHAQQEARR